MAAPNQILLYDSMVANWVVNNFTTEVDSKDLAVLIGTPDRAFAEYVSLNQEIRDGRLPVPRCAITCEDPENDPERYNAGTLRMLGYTDAAKSAIRRAQYPVPVNLPYTINFWSEYYREMNLYEQKMLTQFRSRGYLYLTADIDSISPTPVYGSKLIGLYNDSGLINTGDVEPGTGERILRRTINVHLNAWLWDLDFETAYTLREVELRSYDDDFDPEVFLSVANGPQREVLDVSPDGILQVFAATTKRTPIVEQTFLVDAVVGGTTIRGRDNGLGAISDPVSSQVTGTVDYSTGAVSLTYAIAPDAGSEITAGFFTSEVGLDD